MAEKRPKVTVSFPKQQEHVWQLLLEHVESTGQTNRSAAIISLLEDALTCDKQPDESPTGLYELDRLSRQVEQLHEQVGEVLRRISGPGEEEAVIEELRRLRQDVSRAAGSPPAAADKRPAAKQPTGRPAPQLGGVITTDDRVTLGRDVAKAPAVAGGGNGRLPARSKTPK